MGSCIICGASVEGYTCDSHDQDVVFEFEGSRADQLTPGRFYRGSVDGFADFGVFVDIGDSVTGLLHRSELDRRLESLDWDPGDTVYVQVTGIHENGNVDLAWSIRQSAGEFRGTLIDDPEGDRLDETAESAERASTDGAGSPNPNERSAATAGAAADATNASTATRSTEPGADASGTGSDASASGVADTNEADVGSETNTGSVAGTTGTSESGSSTGSGDAADTAETTGGADTATGGSAGGAALVAPERKRVPIEELDERIGDAVRIEGEVTSARQTGGPTVFEVRDETGSVDCAAFEAAGVRAYPGAEAGDVVRIDGTVERHREALQIETKGLAVLSGEERAAVEDRLEAALAAQAEPGSVEPLAEDPVIPTLTEEIGAVAGAIRRAIIESRPVVVRHAATADGFLAGAAIERAVLPLIRAEHAGGDAVYHYFDRRPLDGSVYGMDDATADVSRMLDDRERHGEKLPLLVFVAAGGGRESADGLGLLDTYGVERVVIDAIPADPEIERAVDALVAPREGSDAGIDAADATGTTGATDAADDAPPTATALAATVAAAVAPEVRAELGHLPATSYWEGAPSAYADLAVEADYDAETVEEIRAAVALLANYHAYEDKRELISDILFATAESEGLAARLATQFRTRLDRAIETAVANTSGRAVGEVAFTVLDTDAFAHRYEFPPTRLLIDALHRRTRTDAAVTIGLGADELHLRSTEPLSLREVAERAAERAPEAGLSARGARDGSIEFLVGERDAALEAVVQAVVSTFGPRG